MTEIQEFDKNDWGYHPLPLLKKVVNRMVQDDLDKDYTSIDELFKNHTTADLESFLSEEL